MYMKHKEGSIISGNNSKAIHSSPIISIWKKEKIINKKEKDFRNKQLIAEQKFPL